MLRNIIILVKGNTYKKVNILNILMATVMKVHQLTTVNCDYIAEIQEKFSNVNFKCLERTDGQFITNPQMRFTDNDSRIFVETQVKRTLFNTCSRFVSQDVNKKLSYFSQDEDKDEIYKLDDPHDLCAGENYVIQNIGHATQLIQILDFNILTDPVFNNLSRFLYPEKTKSHPSIEKLPKIDVVVISHNHRDHVDKSSMQKLLEYHKRKQWPQPQVFVPMGDKKLFESFGFEHTKEVEWYTKISVSKDMKSAVNFISIPANHRSGRYGIDNHKSLVSGWIINPEQEDVIFKYSGDTRSLSDENQLATDAVLWNEIKNKNRNKEETDDNIKIPDIICFEPSGPNYTRCDMDVTHQSTSYSALLKFLEIKNLADLCGKSSQKFLPKVRTIMMHHNKFELGPDRFNEGLFILKKLLQYLELSDEELNTEFIRQKKKIEQNLDKEMLRKSTPCIARPLIASLRSPSSILIHAKDFIITEIINVTNKLKEKQHLVEYLINNTIFPKIGERLNNEQIASLSFDVKSVKKYRLKNRDKLQDKKSTTQVLE